MERRYEFQASIRNMKAHGLREDLQLQLRSWGFMRALNP